MKSQALCEPHGCPEHCPSGIGIACNYGQSQLALKIYVSAKTQTIILQEVTKDEQSLKTGEERPEKEIGEP